MKKILVVLLALCMLALSVGALAAEMPTTVVKIDLATVQSSGSNSDYEVNESGITLKKQNVTYELSGNGSEKNIYLDEIPNGTYYVRLNGASVRYVFCNGKSVIEAVNNTVNSMQYGYLNNAYVIGKGTINAETIMPNGTIECPVLSITDATVNLDWLVSQGKVSLAGSAKVTMTGDGESAPVQLGGVNDNVTLTLSDSAKLYIKHKTNISADPYLMVNGIQLDHGATVTLKDNSYLEAYAGHSGAAIYSWSESNDCHVYVLDNAKLKAVSDGTAIEVDNLTVAEGTLEVVGGDGEGATILKNISFDHANIIASSKHSAITAKENFTVKDSNVNITDSGFGLGVYAGGSLSIKKSRITVKNSGNALYADGMLTIDDSDVDFTAAVLDRGISVGIDAYKFGEEFGEEYEAGIIINNSRLNLTGADWGISVDEACVKITNSRIKMNDVGKGICSGNEEDYENIKSGDVTLNNSTLNIANAEYGMYIANGNASVDKTFVEMNNIVKAGMYTEIGNISVKNSVVKIKEASSAAYGRAARRMVSAGIYSNAGKTSASESWVEVFGQEQINEVKNSIVFYNEVGTVVGNATVPGNDIIGNGTTMQVPAGKTLRIPANATLTIPQNRSLANLGTIEVVGTFTNQGALGNRGTIKDVGTFVNNGNFTNNGKYQLSMDEAVVLPKTGDASMLMLWICLMLGSGVLLVVLLKKKAQATR